VQVTGLVDAKHSNGQIGTVVVKKQNADGPVRVQLANKGLSKLVKAINLTTDFPPQFRRKSFFSMTQSDNVLLLSTSSLLPFVSLVFLKRGLIHD